MMIKVSTRETSYGDDSAVPDDQPAGAVAPPVADPLPAMINGRRGTGELMQVSPYEVSLKTLLAAEPCG